MAFHTSTSRGVAPWQGTWHAVTSPLAGSAQTPRATHLLSGGALHVVCWQKVSFPISRDGTDGIGMRKAVLFCVPPAGGMSRARRHCRSSSETQHVFWWCSPGPGHSKETFYLALRSPVANASSYHERRTCRAAYAALLATPPVVSATFAPKYVSAPPRPPLCSPASDRPLRTCSG